MKDKKIVVLTMLIFFSLSCSLPGLSSAENAPAVTPSFTAVQETVIVDTPVIVPTAVPQVSPTAIVISPTPTPSIEPTMENLGVDGPWILLSASDGLYMVNYDGTGLEKISSQQIFKPQRLADVLAPQGGRIAFVTSSDPDHYRNMVLHVLELPSGYQEAEIPLTSSYTEPGADMLPGDDYSPWMASGELVWSPDGRYLAFTGLSMGVSSDVYLYSTQSGRVSQLTDGPSQAYNLSWSPDGKYILHYGVDSFGTGAGYALSGSWAALADESDVLNLYKPESGDEIVYGWVSNTTFVVSSWSAACGYHALRTYNIISGVETLLFDHCFDSAAFDEHSHNLLVAVGEYTEQFCPCGSAAAMGVYLVKTDSQTAYSIKAGNAYRVEWLENANLFRAELSGGETLLSSSDGNILVTPYQVTDLLPYPDPNRNNTIWGGTAQAGQSSLWLEGKDGSLRQISDTTLGFLDWQPNGEGFALLGDASFCSAKTPAFALNCLMDKTFSDAARVNR